MRRNIALLPLRECQCIRVSLAKGSSRIQNTKHQIEDDDVKWDVAKGTEDGMVCSVLF